MKSTRRLLTVGEAAAYLGRTVGGVREMIYSGKLPAVKIDRRVQLDIRDWERLIDENKVDYRI